MARYSYAHAVHFASRHVHENTTIPLGGGAVAGRWVVRYLLRPWHGVTRCGAFPSIDSAPNDDDEDDDSNLFHVTVGFRCMCLDNCILAYW